MNIMESISWRNRCQFHKLQVNGRWHLYDDKRSMAFRARAPISARKKLTIWISGISGNWMVPVYFYLGHHHLVWMTFPQGSSSFRRPSLPLLTWHRRRWRHVGFDLDRQQWGLAIGQNRQIGLPQSCPGNEKRCIVLLEACTFKKLKPDWCFLKASFLKKVTEPYPDQPGFVEETVSRSTLTYIIPYSVKT